MDITFQWNVTQVDVGTKQMAQFDLEGAELSSDIEAFSVGTLTLTAQEFIIHSFARSFPYLLIFDNSSDGNFGKIHHVSFEDISFRVLSAEGLWSMM